ncbi:hypothetical protein COCSUDRAFT_68136 [Coccomyxa subellipsoidea C-169]|uniref:Uncharacterized protein n=1 Tax=Coccomyxa subellipsoidea (strain C-169) TaxID=574566 RepID=I0YJR2_COCSC|nr:hypothetical protein COCSUDRAFT_68136 [Coccomyxa subellipsoidea C-169]EIE18631.1 hypothetical protein COCSUDRAFT_68136 [Coccomyxa subellipsoidea C-169]|eukprot:XP_005643175.1 hypothetical protein COCSUDRAFT_68136 [Coccomyxa subellipsoidea C-169]
MCLLKSIGTRLARAGGGAFAVPPTRCQIALHRTSELCASSCLDGACNIWSAESLFLAGIYTSSAINCNSPSNCYLCSYCNRRNECPNGDGTQQGRDACSCSYQCDRGCNMCPGRGRRSLMGKGSDDWADLTPDMIF